VPENPDKTSYHHGNLRTALLDAACQLIADEGYEGLTLRAAAERTGVSRSAMYRHFSSKDELVKYIRIDGMERLTEQTRTMLTRPNKDFGDCPLRRLKMMALAYVQFATAEPEIYDVMFRRELMSQADDESIAAAAKAFAVLTDMLDRCKEAGVIRSGDTRRQAFAIWAALHGTITLCRDQAPPVIPEANLSAGFMMVLETLMDGLAGSEDWRPAHPGWNSL